MRLIFKYEVRYSNSGLPIYEGKYIFGAKHGIWTFYNDKYQILKTQKYFFGKLREEKEVNPKTSIWWKKTIFKTENEIHFQFWNPNDELISHNLEYADKDTIITALTKKGSYFKYLSNEFVNDREIILVAAKSSGEVVKYISEIFTSDYEIMLEAIRNNASSLRLASDSLKINKDFIKDVIKRDFHSQAWANNTNVPVESKKYFLQLFEHLDLELKNDTNFILDLIEINFNIFQILDTKFTKDSTFIKAAFLRNNGIIGYIYDNYSLRKLLFLNPYCTEYVNKYYLEQDQWLMKMLVSLNGFFLKTLGKEHKFQKDRKIILTAVKENSLSIEYVSEELKKDKEVVLTAIKYSYGFEFDKLVNLIHKSLLKNEVFITEANKIDPRFELQSIFRKSIRSIEERYALNDRNLLLELVKINGFNLQYAWPKEARYEILYASFELSAPEFSKWVEEIIKNQPLLSDREILLNAALSFQYGVTYYGNLEIISSDKEILFAAAVSDKHALENATKSLKSDRELIYFSALIHEGALQFAEQDLKKDKEFLKELLLIDPGSMEFVDETIKCDKEFILNVIPEKNYWNSYYVLKHIPDNLKNDADFIFQAFMHCGGTALEIMDAKLFFNDDLAIQVLKVSPTCAIKFFNKFRSDKELAKTLIKNDTYLYYDIDDKISNDPEILLSAGKLDMLDETYKNTKEFVLQCVTRQGRMLEYASDKLREDFDIVSAAVYNDLDALKFMGNSMRSNRILFLSVANRLDINLSFKYFDYTLLSDRSLLLEGIKNGMSTKFLDTEWLVDRSFVITVCQFNGSVLKRVRKEFLEDREVVLSAVKSFGDSLKYADDRLKKDREIVLAAVKSSATALKFADPSFRKDREIVLAAMTSFNRFPEIILLADRSLQLDIEIALNVIIDEHCESIDFKNLKYIDFELKKDFKIIKEAIKKVYPNSLKNLPSFFS
jgi:hypothetical protein